MDERQSWGKLRDRRMRNPGATTGYQEAKAAYEVGKMIRQLREAQQLSQRELAERMGTTQSVVGRLEAGGSRPTLATLERVAQALGLRVEVSFRDLKPAS
jgi:ribosome-binding protein aMBF1 (putative translation factor)